MQWIKPDTNFDFVGTRYYFISISVALILLSFVMFFTRGLKMGIDFAGGSEVHIRFHQKMDSSEVRKILSEGGFKEASVQNFGVEGSGEFLIHLEQTSETLKTLSDDITKLFVKTKGEGSFEMQKIEMVGPKVGADLKKRGAWALFYALLGILIYVALRFDYRYSPGGVIALIHDVIITLGAFALLGKKFDLTILAAVLTIIGYSINDTIVIFDRIREVLKAHGGGMDIKTVINKSVNETLSRTILTSFTVFLTVLALFLFGGDVIHDFSFAMLVGVVVGTYSTVFIASPIFMYLYNRAEKLKKM